MFVRFPGKLGGAGRRSFLCSPPLSEVFMSVRPRRGLLGAALLAAAAGYASSAQAQLTNAPIDLQIFRPAMDSKGFITLNSSGVLGQLDVSFGLVTAYARKPLVFTGTQMFGTQVNSFAIENLVTPSLQGAIG